MTILVDCRDLATAKSKKAKNPKFLIQKLSQKFYRNPFFRHFKPPKEYGRHCHRYLGKVKFLDLAVAKSLQSTRTVTDDDAAQAGKQ